jgi:hypothetical protein
MRYAWVALIACVAACGPGGPTESPLGHEALTIDFPLSDAALCTNQENAVYVVGHAPPGARVVRDISFAGDDEVFADSAGKWAMAVVVDEGRNVLTFRIADDHSTEEIVEFLFKRVDSMPQPDCVDAILGGLEAQPS